MPLKQSSSNAQPHRYVSIIEACTDSIDPAHRIPYWEAHNAAELVGLRCRELNGVPLQAQERNYDLGALRLSDISGSAHEIERSQSMVRRLPKTSLFASLLVEGQGYFLQAGKQVWLKPGEVVLYSTDQPYLFGFSQPMRQILVDLNVNSPGCNEWPRLAGPVYVGKNQRLDRYDMASFANIVSSFVQLPEQRRADCVVGSIQSLIGRALGTTPVRSRAATAQLRYLRAKAFITERAADPQFSRDELAAFMGVSLRSLERLFAQFGTTLADDIWARRLAKAHVLLTTAHDRALSIGEIAARTGFSTQAHFSTAFRNYYGVTPRQLRKQSLVLHAN
jgi:AraC-like DNA-binding protein